MRRVLAALGIMICMSGSAWAKPRLAVRAFENKTEDQNIPAGGIMDMMVTELSKSGVFELVEREGLNYIADEQKLAMSGLMDPDTAPQVGKVRGAQYMMTGAISLFYYEKKEKGIKIPLIGYSTEKNTAYVMVEIRILDTATSSIVYAMNKLGIARRKTEGMTPIAGLFIGVRDVTEGGALSSAARNAVVQHVKAIKAINWKE